MELKEIKEKKVRKIEAIEQLNETIGERQITAEEQAKFDTLVSELEVINKEIERVEKLEEIRKMKAFKAPAVDTPSPEFGKDQKRDLQKFSYTKVIRAMASNKPLEGVEAELHREAEKEAERTGTGLQGIGIPSFMLKTETSLKNTRALTAATDTTGGHTVATQVEDIIPYLRPKLQVEALGATVFSGLTSDLKFPRNDAATAGTWEGENDANAASTVTFDSITLAPNRVGTYLDVSTRLLVQSNSDINAWVQAEMEKAVKVAVDAAAINGSGSGGQPLGILGTSGIGDVAGGTNGAVPTWANIIELETDVATGNADYGRLNYLTTPGIRGKLKTVDKASGAAQFVWAMEQMNGYNAFVSTNVPSTLTKGTSNICHAIIFGNWEELYIGQFGGLDMIVDPYTQATTSQVRIVINSWWDVQLRHAAAFSAMQDALV